MKTNVTLILCQCSWGRAVAPVATLMRLGDSREPACPGEPRGQRTLQIRVYDLRIPKVRCRLSPCSAVKYHITQAGRGPQSSFTNERLSCDPRDAAAPVSTRVRRGHGSLSSPPRLAVSQVGREGSAEVVGCCWCQAPACPPPPCPRSASILADHPLGSLMAAPARHPSPHPSHLHRG